MEKAVPTATQTWLGPQFGHLHPLLRRLHQVGGVLQGPVDIRVGSGWLAGWIGSRLARKLGVPIGESPVTLTVKITHDGGQLHWARCFTLPDGTCHDMVSTFLPIGEWPSGYWIEQTGAMQFRLSVDVLDGAWHWRVLGARLHGVPLPVRLLPASVANKRIQGDAYRFQVAFRAPWLGELLSYQGDLRVQT